MTLGQPANIVVVIIDHFPSLPHCFLYSQSSCHGEAQNHFRLVLLVQPVVTSDFFSAVSLSPLQSFLTPGLSSRNSSQIYFWSPVCIAVSAKSRKLQQQILRLRNDSTK